MTPDITHAFEKAISWLELERPLDNAVVVVLRNYFQETAHNPSSYLAIWSPKNVVQVFGGKAVTTEIPHDARIDDEMDARYGVDQTTYLGLPRHGAVFLHNASEAQCRDLAQVVSEAYASRDDTHRMELAVG